MPVPRDLLEREFGTLRRVVGDRLSRSSLQPCDRGSAESDVVLRCLLALDRWDPSRSKLSTFLWKQARFALLDFFRRGHGLHCVRGEITRERLFVECGKDGRHFVDVLPGPRNESSLDDRDELRKHVRWLSRNERRAFELRWGAGLNQRDTARELGLGVRTLSKIEDDVRRKLGVNELSTTRVAAAPKSSHFKHKGATVMSTIADASELRPGDVFNAKLRGTGQLHRGGPFEFDRVNTHNRDVLDAHSADDPEAKWEIDTCTWTIERVNQ